MPKAKRQTGSTSTAHHAARWLALAIGSWLALGAAPAAAQKFERLPIADANSFRTPPTLSPSASNASSGVPFYSSPPAALPAWEAVEAGPIYGVPAVALKDGPVYAEPASAMTIPHATPGNPWLDDIASGEMIAGEDCSVVKRIPDFKSGFFQKLSFTGTWIASFDETDAGFSDLEAYAMFAVPLPTTEWPLLLKPSFTARYLDGPVSPDLPPRLYDAFFQFRWLPKLTDRLRLDLTIEPGVHSDFEHNDADAFRLPGHAVAIWDWTPTRKLVVGAMYLDREDVSVLPAGGLILTPTEDWQLDLLFPYPKISQRLWADGRTEFWHYVAAEFGSGPYSIRRADGRQDVIILSDYRLLYGLERKQLGGIWSKIEAGYVFGREIEFVSNDPRYQPSPTLLLRAGVSY